MKPINPGRQAELDIAKVFAILFMVLIHVYETMATCGTAKYWGTTAHDVIAFMGGPLAAPMFMFAMGVGMVYTRHGNPKEFASRGIGLLLTGYALNFFRYTLWLLLAETFFPTFDLPVGDDFNYSRILGYDIIRFFGRSDDDYYRQTTIQTLWTLTIILMACSLCYILSLFMKGATYQIVKYISSRLNNIYITHWMLISFIIMGLMASGRFPLPEMWTLPATLFIFLASILISKLYHNIKVKN